MSKKLIFTTISIIYIIILLAGASIIKLESSSQPGSDKVLHFIGFFILTLILIFTFESYKAKRSMSITFITALIIGFIIEFMQRGIPGRTFSLLDVLADLLGIVLALVLRWSFYKQ